MIRNYLQSIDGVEIYPLISLVVFILFFVIMFIWMLKVDKNYIKEMDTVTRHNKEMCESSNFIIDVINEIKKKLNEQ